MNVLPLKTIMKNILSFICICALVLLIFRKHLPTKLGGIGSRRTQLSLILDHGPIAAALLNNDKYLQNVH
ncbi:hypothetical protein BD408DRAFT_420933 [Parasitella parasitica]|nr:hypothetical protein BD408DRAFT_420933 [Parasitella parasitica]